MIRKIKPSVSAKNVVSPLMKHIKRFRYCLARDMVNVTPEKLFIFFAFVDKMISTYAKIAHFSLNLRQLVDLQQHGRTDKTFYRCTH